MVLAEVQSGVLLRSFLVAVAVVLPFGLWQWSKVRASRRAAAEAAAAAEPEPPRPALPALEAVIASIAEQARVLRPGESCTVEVPRRVTIDGTEAAAALVDALVRDALRRDALRAIDELDAGDHRVLRCEKG